MFGQHPAKPAICSGCVWNVSSGSGFILILGGPFPQLYGPSYLLVAVAVVLENRGEKFEFWLCVSGRRGLIVCLLDGDGRAGLSRSWCGWVSGTLYA